MVLPKNMEAPIVDYKVIEASAPGKFIISGEYSVVYEKQAIATAIDLRTRVKITPNQDDKLRLFLKDLDRLYQWPVAALRSIKLVFKYSESLEYNPTMPGQVIHLLDPKYIKDGYISARNGCDEPQKPDSSGESNYMIDTKKANDAAIAFLLLYIGLSDSYCYSAHPSIDVEVQSDLPIGSGLGSSSAYSVALCGALMRVFRVSAEKYIISNWAFNIDKFFHGKPSGVDNSIITHGGYILFQSGKMKSMEVEHKSTIRVMLIDTCVSRSTRDLGLKVSERLVNDPTTINSIFTNINELTTQIWRSINDANFSPRSIATHLQANQELLDTLGVGHPRLAEICSMATNSGFTAKQTGAGGGGTAFILYDDTDNGNNLTQLREQLKNANYLVHDHTIGCSGLVVEVISDPEKQSSQS